ncbi:hypothetical protein ADL26_20845, partial [Thermoactinomyces vulgaris]
MAADGEDLGEVLGLEGVEADLGLVVQYGRDALVAGGEAVDVLPGDGAAGEDAADRDALAGDVDAGAPGPHGDRDGREEEGEAEDGGGDAPD